jgi:hypothetical protein
MGIMVKSQPWTSSSGNPISKKPITKRTGRVAQAERAASERETLSSHPSPTTTAKNLIQPTVTPFDHCGPVSTAETSAGEVYIFYFGVQGKVLPAFRCHG